MTMMENRFVPARFKDGYGPVGAWFLLFKAKRLMHSAKITVRPILKKAANFMVNMWIRSEPVCVTI